MADVDPALGQQILDVAQGERISHVHHHDQTDNLRRTVEISERVGQGMKLPRPRHPRAFGLTLPSAPSRSDPVKHHAQIVCGHLGDSRKRESNGLGDRCDGFEVSQTPGRVAIAKFSVERLVARGRCKSFAFVRAIEIERRRRRKYRRRTPDQSERRIPRSPSLGRKSGCWSSGPKARRDPPNTGSRRFRRILPSANWWTSPNCAGVSSAIIRN